MLLNNGSEGETVPGVRGGDGQTWAGALTRAASTTISRCPPLCTSVHAAGDNHIHISPLGWGASELTHRANSRHTMTLGRPARGAPRGLGGAWGRPWQGL